MYVRQVVSDPKARAKPCLRCQRSLLKHLDDRHCPDCGLSVWMSLNANDALDRSRPDWLNRTAQGAWILALAQPVAFVAYVIALGGHELPSWRDEFLTDADIGQVGAAASQPADLQARMKAASDAAQAAVIQPSVAVALGLTLIGAFFLISAIGLRRLTSNEHRYPDRQRTARLAARIVAGVATFVGVTTLALGLTHLTQGWPAHTAFAWILLIVVELTFAAVTCAGWLYLRPIARRGSRSGLAKLCGYLLFLPLLTFAKAAPFIGFWFLYLLMPLATLLPLVYLPLSTVLFVKFARMLSAAAPHAQAAWDAESAPVLRPPQ
jgi:hypothetical protein